MADSSLRGAENLQRVLANIARLPTHLQQKLLNAVGQYAELVRAQAEQRAPLGPNRGDPDYPGKTRRSAHYLEYTNAALRQSGQVDRPRASTQGIVAAVTFGGLAAPYAEVQHERADFHHPSKRAQDKGVSIRAGQSRPGQSHFLYGHDPRGPSAWEELREKVQAGITKRAAAIALQAIREANRP